MRLRGLMLDFPLKPVIPEKFRRVRSADRPVAAAQVVGRTVLVASPADAFGVLGVQRRLRMFRFHHVTFCSGARQPAPGVLLRARCQTPPSQPISLMALS